MRERERESGVCYSALLQDACQLTQSTVEGSKLQKISSVKIHTHVTSNKSMESSGDLQKGDLHTI